MTIVKAELKKWSTEHLKLLSEQSYPRFNAFARTPSLVDNLFELRHGLLDFIADFASWDNSTVTQYLDTSRTLTQAAHQALGGGTSGDRPLVVDTFAGGGAIPVEATRVGADVFASDLNPIPVLLNTILLQYIPRYGQRLAVELRKSAEQVQAMAANDLGPLFAMDSDGSVPIAFMWARRIRCEGPGCGIDIPLLRSTLLSKREPIAHIELAVGSQGVLTQLRSGLGTRSWATIRGGKATCPKCGHTTPEKHVKAQTTVDRGGADTSRLYAVLVQGAAGRRFREPTPQDIATAEAARERILRLEASSPDSLPVSTINPIRPYKNTVGICIVTRLGVNRFRDLYTSRQLCALLAFEEAIRLVTVDSGDDGLDSAVRTLLFVCLDRLVNGNSSLSRWNVNRSTVEGLFSKQALQVVWDFVEVNPIGPGMGSWSGAIEWIASVLEANRVLDHEGTVARADARKCPLPNDACELFFTDPPYFAAIPYADLSDVFYVWLRRNLREIHPSLFERELVEKAPELIVTNSSLGPLGETKDGSYSSKGMATALEDARRIVKPSGLGCVVFADSTTSSWEAILNAVIDSGWVITASWPVDTELQNRTRAAASASLQSSIFMVCRPRENASGFVEDAIGDWRDVLQELPRRIHEWMPRLADEGVVGADAIFACLGPALEIFSRYSRVEKASGEQVSLKEYLEQVWAAVAREALALVFSDADASGFEEDARLTAMWLWTLHSDASSDGTDSDGSDKDDEADDDSTKKTAQPRGYILEYDAARKIAQGLGAHLEDLAHLIEIKGDKATLLSAGARARYLFGRETSEPTKAARPKIRAKQLALDFGQELRSLDDETDGEWALGTGGRIGSTTLDQLHQSMILFGAGRAEALRRLLVEEGVGRSARFWALAQALAALYPPGTDERRWVEGVQARKKGLGL